MRFAAPRAVLFDFDGVLVDSEAYHWRAFREILAPFGISLSRALYDRRYLVYDDRAALLAMLRDAGRATAGRAGVARTAPARGAAGRRLPPELGRRIDALVRRKRAAFRRLCGKRLRVGRPAARLVRSLARRLPLAIVSGAAREEISIALKRAGIAREFRVIVAAGEVRRCKPNPGGYLRALGRLGFEGGEGCLAIEDSPGGIRAARAAGLRVLAIATSYAPGVLRRAGAGRVVPSIASVTPAAILGSRRSGRPARKRAKPQGAS
jgi:beta-phosphoglucomutase-like phosphatase (HAD superfamily)